MNSVNPVYKTVVSYFLCVSLRLCGKQVVRAHLPQRRRGTQRYAEKKFESRHNHISCLSAFVVKVVYSLTPKTEGSVRMSFYPPIRLALVVCLFAGATQQMIKPTNYPPARKSDQLDNYHGVKVADPYRWLEDLDSEQTSAWVAAQNRVTSAYLAAIPEREAIRKRLTELWNYE